MGRKIKKDYPSQRKDNLLITELSCFFISSLQQAQYVVGQLVGLSEHGGAGLGVRVTGDTAADADELRPPRGIANQREIALRPVDGLEHIGRRPDPGDDATQLTHSRLLPRRSARRRSSPPPR